VDHGQAVSFIWSVADLLRDSFKRGKYQDVILPLTVLRRIDSVLAPTKARVLQENAKYAGKLDNLDPLLRRASGYAFYNTSRYDFERLVADPSNLAANLRNYIAGFSPNMREVVEKFDFDNTIAKLVEADLLYLVMERFKNVDLSPASIDNHATSAQLREQKAEEYPDDRRSAQSAAALKQAAREVAAMPNIGQASYEARVHLTLLELVEGGADDDLSLAAQLPGDVLAHRPVHRPDARRQEAREAHGA
jgi:hypothetical protein